ncbi:MAG TPA: hypothetical protein VLG11_06035 [Candidatus Saccharimonadales bacterium]|nr:hypothetical protein [Candidatus Saccharimonadales bacterium]
MNISYDVYRPVDPEFVKKAVILGRSEREAQLDAGVLSGWPGSVEGEVDRIMDWFKASRIRMSRTAGVILSEKTGSNNVLTIGQGYAYKARWTEETGEFLGASAGLFDRLQRKSYAVALGGVCVRRAACGQGFSYELASHALAEFEPGLRMTDPDNVASLLLSGALDSCDRVAERNNEPIGSDCTVGDFREQLRQLAMQADPNSGIL